MTDTEKKIAVWVDNEGEKVQVGWASPDNGGARSVNLFNKYKGTSLKDVSFDDAEPLQSSSTGVTVVTNEPEVVVEEEVPLPSEPIEDAPDENLAAEPVDAGVAPEDSEPVVEATIEPDEPELLDEDDTWDEDSDDAEDVSDDFDTAPAVVEDNYDDHQDH